MEMANKDQVGVLGMGENAGVGKIKVAHMLGSMGSVAREVMSNEMKNRRIRLAPIILEHAEKAHLIQLLKLSNKELKKRSTKFMLIYRYLDSLQLDRFFYGDKVPTPQHVRRINVTLNSLINSKPFLQCDFEDINTDYFDLLIGVFVGLKNILGAYNKRFGVEDKNTVGLTHVTSEIGLRLYSLYVDNRLDSAQSDYEEVRLR